MLEISDFRMSGKSSKNSMYREKITENLTNGEISHFFKITGDLVVHPVLIDGQGWKNLYISKNKIIFFHFIAI